MLSHKLVLDDVVDQAFKLYAIHASIEDYRLAFLLNRNLKIRLSRAKNDLDLFTMSGRAFFSLFNYNDQQEYCNYYLISNTAINEPKIIPNSGALFAEEEFSSSTTFLLPELKKVDFLLKIEGDPDSERVGKILKSLNEIPQIATAYLVGEDKLKSKENLIFD